MMSDTQETYNLLPSTSTAHTSQQQRSSSTPLFYVASQLPLTCHQRDLSPGYCVAGASILLSCTAPMLIGIPISSTASNRKV